MRRPGRSSSKSRWRGWYAMAASTKLARYCAKSSTVDGLLYDGTNRVDGFEADRRRRRSASNPSTRLVPSYRRPSTVDDFAQYRASFVDAAIAYQPRHLLFENLRPGRRIHQNGASDRPVTVAGVKVVGMVTTPVSSGLP